MLALLVVGLFAVGVGFALWGVAEPWRTLSYVGMGLGIVLGFLLLWGRLALMAPASLRYRTFGFEQGWRLGRGQTWRLFALLLFVILIALALTLAFIALIVIVAMVFGVGAGALAMEDPQAWEAGLDGLLLDQPAWLIGAGLILLLPVAWLQGFSQVLMTAPYARVVEVLAREAAPAEPISADTGPDPL